MDVVSLIEHIERHPHADQGAIAGYFDVSARTVREYMRRANDAIEPAASIVLKRGSGYTLDVRNEPDYQAVMSQLRDSCEAGPVTRQARVGYLLNDLLSRNDWVTLTDLARSLYFSRSTLSQDLKEVEQFLNRYDLRLVSHTRNGIRIEGAEMSRRLCLAAAVMEYGMNDSLPAASLLVSDGNRGGLKDILSKISSCVIEASDRFDFHINATAYQNLLVHIAVAILRIKEGCCIPMESKHLDHIRGAHEWEVASEVSRLVRERLAVELPQEEIAYIAIHLAGKQAILPGSDDEEDDLVISDEVWNVVSDALDAVWWSFHIDFREDLELRMNLARHIVPLSVRLKYRMELKNPMLQDIKTRYLLAWSIAACAAEVIGQRYGSELSADETGYIALAFALALERGMGEPPKKNILMVCASGTGSARLLEYRVRQAFGSHIDSIATCDVLHVSSADFSTIDYVFSTVPIQQKLPVPVRMVSALFDAHDADGVRDLFDRKTMKSVASGIFDRRLFFPSLSCGSKDEALHILCRAMCEVFGFGTRFEELVRAREETGPTSFGNNIAMPHPLQSFSDRTCICVGLLERPVVWDDRGTMVQAIFLISFAKKGAALGGLFDRLADLFMDAAAIEDLVTHRDWETLERLAGEYGLGEPTR